MERTINVFGLAIIAALTVTAGLWSAPAAAESGEGLLFTPVPPCIAAANTGLTGGSISTYQITGNALPAAQNPEASTCGVPDGAAAVMVNVTATNPQRPGNLRLSAAGETPTGGIVNFANTTPPLNNSNAVTVDLSPTGAIDLGVNCGNTCTSVTTGAVLTIYGYYTPPADTVDGLAYNPITPCTAFDTRTTQNGAGPYNGNETRTYQITGTFPSSQGGGNTTCGIPTDATAVFINLVATNSTTPGAFATGPDTTWLTQPVVAHTPLTPGLNNSNAISVPLTNTGTVDVQALTQTAGATANARGVILGYYAPPSTEALELTTITPCTVLDTRTTQNGSGPYNGDETRTYQITGTFPSSQGGGNTTCNIPINATAVVVNIVAINPTTPGNLRAAATGTTPTGGIVNYTPLTPAMNNANAVVVPLSPNGQLNITANAGPNNNGQPTTNTRAIVLGHYTPPTTTEHCGAINTNQTWHPGTHHITCDVVVTDGATLTILPGTTIKASAGILVNGSLVVAGTADEPVIMTSDHDDTAGGDTNQDGNTTTPNNNDWSGIRYSNNSQSTSAILISHLDMRHAATFNVDGQFGRWYGSFNITDSTFTNMRQGVILETRGQTTSIVEDNVLTDIALGSALTVRSSGPIEVKGNHVTGSEIPYTLYSGNLNPAADLTDNTATNNTRQVIILGGIITANDALLLEDPLAYEVGTRPPFTGAGTGLTIQQDAALTIQAGTVIKGSAAIVVNGSLVVAGTSDEPVIMTSAADDTVRGDTNADGNATGPGGWAGILYDNNDATAAILISNLDMRHASRFDVEGQFGRWSGAISVTDSTFSNMNQGVVLEVSNVDQATVTANRNLFTGTANGAGLTVESRGPIEARDNHVTNSNTAYVFYSGDLHPGADLTGNTATNNTRQVIVLGGIITANDAVMLADPLAYEIGTAGPFNGQVAGITIQQDAMLTILPGTIVKGSAAIVVNGSLVVAGTSDEPVIMTSAADDTVRGDTNADGNATGPGGWAGILYDNNDATAAILISNLDMRHASRFDVEGQFGRWRGTISITDSVFTNFSQGITLEVSNVDPTTVRVLRNVFTDIASSSALTVKSLGPIEVRENHVTGSGIPYNFYSGDLNPAADLTDNTATNNTRQVIVLGGIITVNDAVLPNSQLAYEVGTTRPHNGRSAGITIRQDAVLTIVPGAVLMNSNLREQSMLVEGTLVGSATDSNPIVFTSIHDPLFVDAFDDSEPVAPGDWPGIRLSGSDAAVLMSNVTIRFAHSGIFAPTGLVSVSGTIAFNTFGVRACPLPTGLSGDIDCIVAARGVDWGSSSGPGPLGTGNPVCGAVLISPWIGGEGPDTFAGTNDCAAVEATYWDTIRSELDALCAATDPTACNLVDGYQACWQQIADAAVAVNPNAIYFPELDSIADITSDVLVSSLESYELSQGPGTSVADSLGLLGGLADGVNNYFVLTGAANSCVGALDG